MPMWTLSAVEEMGLLERFLRYVQVDTQSDETSQSQPSTDKQKNLARLLVAELSELGLRDVHLAETGHVYATLMPNWPANLPAGRTIPAVGFVAHVDTYHGTSGANVRPQVLKYTGGDISLPGTGDCIPVASNPNLNRCLGHTIVHTDGTTLLGADDKAGVAEIMTMLAWLKAHSEFAHGEVRVAFTPDEEIGRGVDGFDVARFSARYAYTLDGEALGEVQDETFSADAATLTITGHDVHPGQAKGVMINAVRVAAAAIEALPRDRLPETTEEREPYLHAYEISGDVSRAQIKFLVRAFTDSELQERASVLRQIVRTVETQFPGARLDLEFREQYRNMGQHIASDRKVLDFALEAVRRQGLEPVRKAIRGGTDGSRLSALGVLTPNLFAGMQAAHSVREWVSLSWMSAAVGVCLQLLAVWAEG